jgi:uncharacterized protein YdaU (DUF1376 family)
LTRWYKREGAAFIQSTLGLSLEEKGAFALCLDLIYANSGPIADDARWLAGVCNVSVRKWSALRKRLLGIGKLYVTDNDKLMNNRAEREIAALDVRHEDAAENDAKGRGKCADNAAKSRETEATPPRGVTEIDRPTNESSGLGQADKNRGDQNRGDQKEKGAACAGAVVGPQEYQIPDWVPKRAWDDFIASRKNLRKAPTERAMELVVIKLAKLRDQGHGATAVLDQSTRSGWQDVYPLKTESNHHGNGKTPPSNSFAEVASRVVRRRAGEGVFDSGSKVIDVTPRGGSAGSRGLQALIAGPADSQG